MPSGDFSILLPGLARVISTMLPAGSAPIAMVVLDWDSQDPPVRFIVAESPVEPAETDPNGLLDRARTEQVGTGTIVDSTDRFYQGYPAVDFSYGVDGQLDFVRDVVANGHLFQLVALGSAVDPRTAEAFFDTIEFPAP